MADIFISYKQEERPKALALAEVLERQDWTVWWDPKLRAGQRFDDVIQDALREAKCVIVLWSSLSVKSDYVKDEATYALREKKLVPVFIEEIELPFRFAGLHTTSLIGWDGSEGATTLQGLIDDITIILGPPPVNSAVEKQQHTEITPAPKSEEKNEWQPADLTTYETVRPNPATATPLPLKPRRPWGLVVIVILTTSAIGSLMLIRDNSISIPNALPNSQSSQIETNELLPGNSFQDQLPDGSMGPEMIVIPSGSFRMGDQQGNGDPDEQPVHTVNITNPFAIGRYEVSFDDYDQFTTATGLEAVNDEGWGRGRQPVINVSLKDAKDYAAWLSKQTGKHYRLPSEAEWEYAARANKQTAYWWGKEMKQGMANCDGCDTRWGGKQTAPVGSYPANPLGLFDTAGNVWEWMQDCWHESYHNAPTDGSVWLEADGGYCKLGVLRGGSWITSPPYLRSSFRSRHSIDIRTNLVGFRVVRDLE